MATKSKYRNKKCEFNGVKFDSKAEMKRYIDLLDMRRRGLISCLKLQPRFLLLEGFTRNGRKFIAEFYIADFEYKLDFQTTVIEDVKGVATEVYKNKRKHFLKLNPDLIFKEVKLVGNKWEIKEL